MDDPETMDAYRFYSRRTLPCRLDRATSQRLAARFETIGFHCFYFEQPWSGPYPTTKRAHRALTQKEFSGD
jgi:hypothetical protein